MFLTQHSEVLLLVYMFGSQIVLNIEINGWNIIEHFHFILVCRLSLELLFLKSRESPHLLAPTEFTALWFQLMWVWLLLIVEYSGTQRHPPPVLPGGLLHLLQDPRGQDRWCGPGSTLSRPAGHVDVYEDESRVRRRANLLQSRQETSVGRCYQSVLVCVVPAWVCGVWLHVQCFILAKNKMTSGLPFFLSSPVRNALVVVAAAVIAFSWDAYGYHVFTITGEISQGLPPFRPPPTSDTTSNGTIVSFGEIVEVKSKEKSRWGQKVF